MFYISCFASASDTRPCMILSYKTKKAAIQRAEKAHLTFDRVEVTESNSKNAFAFDLEVY